VDINNDELRRQLKLAEQENKAAMGPWRELLNRMFDKDSDVSTAEKAQALGVPGRRQFFKVGGATILGAAVLAACGSDASTPAETGNKGDTGGGNLDITLLRTASSVEVLAVNVYDKAAQSSLITTAAVGAAAALFRDHHQAHAEALQAATTNNGGEAYTKQNQAVFDTVVKPALDSAKTEADVLALALALENAAASTYVFAAGKLSTAEFRQTIMSIGGVEARHASVLMSVINADDPTKWVVDGGFVTDAKRVPDAAFIS
jgi:hypothetical protein